MMSTTTEYELYPQSCALSTGFGGEKVFALVLQVDGRVNVMNREV